MNKLLTTLFGLAVTCVTAVAHAQAPAAAPAATAAPTQAAPAAAAVPKVAEAAPAGAKSLQAKVAMCIGCHGIKGYQGTFPEVYRVPMISGQSAAYIMAALTEYKQGDRKHPTMRSIATSLTEQDIKDIANYYSTNGGEGPGPGKESPAAPSPQVSALLQKAACVSCHGANFSTPIQNYPRIAGQHSDYLFAALRAYKMENNPTMGRNNAVMGAIAKQFSTKELKVLADYVGSLDGQLKTVPESKFR
jgi:cytochrome c553